MYNIPNFYFFLNSPAENPARISPKEISGASGGFLPKPLLFHLRHPNSKTNQPKFWQILSPKNSFAKTLSALFRHLPEYLEGRTPKEKHPFLFQEKIHPRQIKKARDIFLWGCRGSARQWRNDTSVRFNPESPRAPRVRLVGVRVAFKIHSNFVQQTPPKFGIQISAKNMVGAKRRLFCIPPTKS